MQRRRRLRGGWQHLDWAEPGPDAGRVRSLVSTRSFGLVLLGLALSYCLSVARTGKHGGSLVLAVQIATVLIALRASRAHRAVRFVAEATIVFAAAAAVFNLVGKGHVASGLVFVSGALLYFVTPLAILRAIVRSGTVDREVVLGVIDAYVMIGMFFAFSYRGMGILLSGPFFGSGGDGTTPQTLFFSFTTLTTTGYGNLIPATNLGQSFAVLEMLIGQLFLVTALAKIVSAWRPSRWGMGMGPATAPQPVPGEPATPGELEQMLERDGPGGPAGPVATAGPDTTAGPEPPTRG